MDEFKSKAADHSFDGAKTVITLGVRVVGVYLTLVAIFFAVFSQSQSDNQLVQNFRFVVMAATALMAIVIYFFYLLTWRALNFYFDVMEELATADLQHRLQSGRRKANLTGALMCLLGLGAMFCILVLLVMTYL